ncbi:hypothetical protein [Halorubrum sp. 2020YC2]|uniref:hypothetical protein n=1 Tax=Halorubrum sp. 2020YC2 TaxID=2836432 RepID=UPI001BECA656|nr:hypothetical protein [Halorubrum sp. 2020YC2]QWC20387.1 hypothetical protein KI388_05410 [Halorubrum sp. 2020YC2]
MPSDRLRRVRDAVVAQRTALIERAALLAIGLAIAGWNLFTIESVSRIDGFRLLPTFAGVTLALLAVSEFLPEKRTNAILAIRLTFLALLLVSVGFGVLLLLFMLNNAP